MAKMLVKTRSILIVSSVSGRCVQFASWDEDGLGLERLVQVGFDVWVDMGRPEKVTLTIEPGDLLNDEVSS